MGRRQENRLLLSSVNMSLISALGLWLCLRLKKTNGSKWAIIPAGATSVIGLLGALMSLHMRSLKPSDNHTRRTLFSQYIVYVISKTLGTLLYPLYVKRTQNAGKADEQLLFRILNWQKETEYGKTWGFHSIKSREEFRHRHPLTNYDQYAEYMERGAKGENNLLTKDKITYVALTSGTTGKNKKYAITDKLEMFNVILFFSAYIRDAARAGYNLGRHLYFQLPAPERKTEAGIRMGPYSGKTLMLPAESVYPSAALKLTQEDESYYAQAVFALADEELDYIDGFSSNLMFSLFKFIERHTDMIANDIAKGRFSDDCPIKDASIREELSKFLTPKPERAAAVRKELAKGEMDLARRLWPKLRALTQGRTGGFAHCAKILEASYFRGINTKSMIHAATEAWFGMNHDFSYSNPSREVYRFMPQTAFNEFIPADEVDKDQPRTVFIDQVKVGECYELVVTTYNGLYRYRMGDIIKVVGFFNDLPEYEFCYRIGQRLNLAFERTPESFINDAVDACSSTLPDGTTIVAYTATESHVLEGITGERSEKAHYVFFMEVMMKDDEEYQLLDEQTETMDTCIRNNHSPYDIYREKGSIGPLKVVQVKSGSFDILKHTLWGGFQSPQFKMPRVIRREDLLKGLLEQRCQF